MCNRTGEIIRMKKDVLSTKIFIAFIDHWISRSNTKAWILTNMKTLFNS